MSLPSSTRRSGTTQSSNERVVRRTPSVRAALGAGIVATAILLAPARANASEVYVATIERTWGNLKKLPVSGDGCMLCHTNDNGMTGTVTRPFGITMRGYGLKGAKPSTLTSALTQMRTHATVAPIADSDHDSVPDYTEVAVDHTNPNDPNSVVEPAPVGAGGEGGQSNGTGDTGAGGESVLPPEDIPAAADLPPPFTHGCNLAQRPSSGGPIGLALLALLYRRRRRPSAR